MDNGRKKNILLGVLIVGVISMTVAFAALSTNLRLNGTANVAATRWNIHFQNWERVSITTMVNMWGETHENTAEYPQVNQLSMSDNSNVTKVEDINITLNQPKDAAKYTFQIKNDGTIDAKLDNFSVRNTPSNDLIDYEVKCYYESIGSTEVTMGSILAAGQTIYCHLEVEYKEQTNSHTAGSNQVYHQNALNTSISAQWTWVQPSNGSSGSSYGTSFSGTYGYDYNGAATSGNGGSSEWASTLDPNVRAYLRSDGTKLETCGVFGSGQAGTVCLVSSHNNSDYATAGSYASDFADVSETATDITTSAGLQSSGLKGYALAKADEMLSKGASSCDIDPDDYVICQMTAGGACYVYSSGGVDCYDSDYTSWYINSSGSADSGAHLAP